MTALLFVDVDTQQDFCHPDGALFVKQAPAVLPNIRRLVKRALDQDALLVGSVDTHDHTAWEFAANGGPFPPHCVKGTPGWLKVKGTLPERAVFVPDGSPACTPEVPADTQAVVFEKQVYSLFANPRAEPLLDSLLQARGLTRGDVRAVVFGVATDYCVKEAALGLRARGFEVAVVTDAIAPVDPATGEQALNAMKAAGCHTLTARSLT